MVCLCVRTSWAFPLASSYSSSRLVLSVVSCLLEPWLRQCINCCDLPLVWCLEFSELSRSKGWRKGILQRACHWGSPITGSSWCWQGFVRVTAFWDGDVLVYFWECACAWAASSVSICCRRLPKGVACGGSMYGDGVAGSTECSCLVWVRSRTRSHFPGASGSAEREDEILRWPAGMLLPHSYWGLFQFREAVG